MVLPSSRKKPIPIKKKLIAVGFAEKLPNEVASTKWSFYKRKLFHERRRKLSEKVMLVSDIPSGKAESGLVRILNKGGKTLGTTTFMRIQKDGREYLLISEVDVLTGHKREGFMGQMLSEISYIARKSRVNRLELDVDSRNIAAISAYQQFGFRKQSEHVEETAPRNTIYRLVKLLD
jgi:RimJ/RimL family protein N-acetyltransferase